MTTAFQLELKNIAIFVVISFILALGLLAVVYILSFTSKIDYEKSSAYECGFQPFSEVHFPFEVQFAIIGIMFLLFDIEILYLYPIATSILQFQTMELIYVLVFFIIVAVGLFYEIRRKVLNN